MFVKVIIALSWCYMGNIDAYSDFVNNTKDAMEIIVEKHYPEKMHHFVRTKPEKTREVADGFVEAAIVSDLPVEFLMANGWRESYFRQNTTGAIGEMGVMQIHGVAVKHCRRQLKRRVNVKHNVKDNIVCGALWLRYSIDQCDGNYRHGIHKYMSGKHCEIPKSWKLYKRANIRMELMEEFENYVATGK